jgi:hypothetical protein
MPGTLTSKFHKLIASSSLLPSGVKANLVGQIHGTDATPYHDQECVAEDSIKVGDAALALDPLSSSGVQKAIQTALAGSAVVNTLLRRPRARALAQQFYHETLSEASNRHRAWASGHYAQAAANRKSRFWRERAEASPPPDAAPAGVVAATSPDAPVCLAPGVRIIKRPCLVDQFIEMREAVSSPSLGTPVAFLGGLELAPLLRYVRSGVTPRELTRSWLPWVPPRQGGAIVQWLFSRSLLVPLVPMERGGA